MVAAISGAKKILWPKFVGQLWLVVFENEFRRLTLRANRFNFISFGELTGVAGAAQRLRVSRWRAKDP
jgi:hypothetical protein